MDFLNFLNENTDCPKVLTTGIPRTYSTASLVIFSRAALYASMSFLRFLPTIKTDIIRNPTTTVAMHRSPIFQSKYSNIAIIANGVVIATVRSGRMCAIKFSSDADESMMIFRILPLPSFSMCPSGILRTFSTHFSLTFATVLNAPICEQPSAQKYTHIALTAYFTASKP